MLPAPMASSQDRFETVGGDSGETSNFVQSAQRQIALADSKPSEEIEWVWGESFRRSIPRREKKDSALIWSLPEVAVADGERAGDVIAPAYKRGRVLVRKKM
jgi:hypothetical protein